MSTIKIGAAWSWSVGLLVALAVGPGGAGSLAWGAVPATTAAPTTVQQVIGVPAGSPTLGAGGAGGAATGAGGTAGPASEPVTGAGAGPLPGAGGVPGGGGAMGPEFMLILMVGLGLMIAMSFMASRKDRKRRVQMLAGLSLGDRVVTSGGMIGTIVELREGEVSLRSDEGNVRLRFTRESVSRVLQRSAGAQGAA